MQKMHAYDQDPRPSPLGHTFGMGLRTVAQLALVVGLGTFSGARAQASTADGTWTLTGDLTSPRYDGTATMLRDGRVVLAGGVEAGNFQPAVDRVELYDPTAGMWRVTGSLVTARTAHSATLLRDGRVLIVGGYDRFGQPLRSAELYDPVLGLWSPTGSLGSVRARHGATLLESGKVLVVAGVSLVETTGSAELYDPATGTWSPTGGLAQPRVSHTTTLLEDGSVLVTGGRTSLRFNPSFELTRSAERYDPATGACTAIADLPQVRAEHSATLLASGDVLVAGGFTSDGTNLSAALLFDPGSGQWRSGGNLERARRAHAATRLANGDVLVVGGVVSTFEAGTAELYDSHRGLWKRAASTNVARVGLAATLLSDGRVLAAGSPPDDFFFEGGPPSTVSTELYTPAGAIDAGYTGAWFDPAQSGHGILLEVLPDRRVHAQWFTFNPAGDQQAWFGGIGTYSGNVATIGNVLMPTGGRWIPNFNPATVVLNPIGTLTLTFSDRDHGRVEFNLGQGYGSGAMNLTRLTAITTTAAPVTPATNAAIGKVGSVATDAPGNVYFSASPGLIYKLDTQGRVTTIAGTGVAGYSGDGGPASQAQLDIPFASYPENLASPDDYSELVGGLAVDATGKVYVADAYNNRVRRIGPDGIISTVVGNGTRGNSDGTGTAIGAQVYWPQGVAVDSANNLYVTTAYATLRKVTPGGSIATLASTNCGTGFLGPGFCVPEQIAVNSQGSVFVPDAYCRVREVRPNGSIVTIAGDDRHPSKGYAFTCGYSGDAGPAIDAALSEFPYGVATDTGGNLYIADTYSDCIRRVDSAGTIRTVVGACRSGGFSGDGGPATTAKLTRPHGVAVDAAGNLYIADTGNHRIRKVAANGIITTIAGNGSATAAPMPAPIVGGHSGSWFDPAQGGHGLMIEVLPGNQMFAAWFTYNPAGDQQAWFTGVGTYAGNRATIPAVQPTGGRWIPNFDPSAVVINPWGTLEITFHDCNHGRVDFASVRGYGTGSMNLTRLTRPDGTSCP